MLTVDVMFINGVPFIVSLVRGLNRITAEFLTVRTAKNLASRLDQIVQLYALGGFQVGTVMMDNEFK
jgi:hypothetical protein